MKKVHEELAIVGTIDPQAAGQTTATTDVIDMQEFQKVAFIVSTGAVLATGTVNFVVPKATSLLWSCLTRDSFSFFISSPCIFVHIFPALKLRYFLIFQF